MLPGHRLINTGQNGIVRSKVYRTTVASSTSAVSYTFSSVSIGSASLYRYVLVGVTARASSSRTISSITIGGVTATIFGTTHNTSGGYDTLSSFAIASVPTGTTANIVITLNSTTLRCGCSVWTIEGLDSTTARTYSGDVTTAHTATLDVKADGWVFATGMDYSNTGSVSWSNLTQQVAYPIPSDTSFKVYAADSNILTDDTVYAVSASNTGAFPSFSFLSLY